MEHTEQKNARFKNAHAARAQGVADVAHLLAQLDKAVADLAHTVESYAQARDAAGAPGGDAVAETQAMLTLSLDERCAAFNAEAVKAWVPSVPRDAAGLRVRVCELMGVEPDATRKPQAQLSELMLHTYAPQVQS